MVTLKISVSLRSNVLGLSALTQYPRMNMKQSRTLAVTSPSFPYTCCAFVFRYYNGVPNRVGQQVVQIFSGGQLL